MSQPVPSAVPRPERAQGVAGSAEPDAFSGSVGDAVRRGSQDVVAGSGVGLELRDGHVAAILAVVSSVLFGFVARLRFLHATLAGDEPHYLIFNVALEKYGSLNIMSVYQNRDYWWFYPALIEPHTSPGPDGQLLPLHGFGGPLLWHIPYLVFGRAGAMAFMVAVSVLIVVNIFFFLRELGIVRLYAGLVAALFAIGSPVYIYSSMLFIEPIAALAVLYAMRVLCRPVLSGWRVAVASAGLGIIPWVHGRFTLFSVLIGAMLLWRIYREKGLATLRPYLQCVAPLGVLLVGYEVYNLVVWHSLNPAPANANVGNGLFQIPLHKGFLGTMLDRSYGLIPNFPIFALAIPGVALAMRRGLLRLHAMVAVTVAPYVLLVSTFSMWWGGYCPPARYIAAVTPLLAYYVAATLQRLHHWFAMAAATLLALFAAALGVIGDIEPALRWNWHEWPPAQTMVRLGKLVALPFARYVPSSFLPDQAKNFGVWIVGLIAVTIALWFIGRRIPASRIPDRSVDLRKTQTR